MFSRGASALIRNNNGRRSLFFSSQASSVLSILEQVQNGQLKPSEAQSLLVYASEPSPEDAIKAFANLDHTRCSRTGFPEAIFAAGKTPEQVARILDDMARSLNEEIAKGDIPDSQRAILATR